MGKTVIAMLAIVFVLSLSGCSEWHCDIPEYTRAKRGESFSASPYDEPYPKIEQKVSEDTLGLEEKIQNIEEKAEQAKEDCKKAEQDLEKSLQEANDKASGTKECLERSS